MAFNPFHGFRKHRRVIFAVLTIICMLTFVLAGNFRGADAFDWLLSKLGASKRQGEVVTVMYGDKVYEGEVNNRTHLRQIANDFLKKSFGRAIYVTSQDLLKVLNKGAADEKNRSETFQIYIQARPFLIAQSPLIRAELSE